MTRWSEKYGRIWSIARLHAERGVVQRTEDAGGYHGGRNECPLSDRQQFITVERDCSPVTDASHD